MLAREAIFMDTVKDCIGYFVVIELDYSIAVDSSLFKKKIRFIAVEKLFKTIIVAISAEFGFIKYLYL